MYRVWYYYTTNGVKHYGAITVSHLGMLADELNKISKLGGIFELVQETT